MIYVGTPHTRAFEAQHVASLLYAKTHFMWDPIGGKAVDVARCRIATNFLRESKEFKYLALIDSDATFAPEALTRLASRDLPVVTGFIYRRKLPPMPTIGVYQGRNEKGHHYYDFMPSLRAIRAHADRHGLDRTTNNELVLDKTRHDILEIDGCGMHFCMIRRDVLESLSPPYFQNTSWGSGEDFAFCRKVKEAGWKIYADLSVHTGHILGPGNTVGIKELLLFMDNIKEGVFADVANDKHVP